MTAPIRLGFVALNDAAALLVARARGDFETAGLAVDLVREASWATVRDKLVAGMFEGAHLLAPLALAITAGAGCDATPLIAPFAFNVGGAAITMASAAGPAGLAELVGRRRAMGARRVTLASVFPFSIHDYCLRAWIEAAGLDPERDLRLTVAAPSRGAQLLAQGVIDGFCAGEPWNAQAEATGAGHVVARVADVLPRTADKVLALRADGHAAVGEAALTLVRVLEQVSAWIADRANRAELVAILAAPGALDLEAGVVGAGLSEIQFHGSDVNRPDAAGAAWMIDRMKRARGVSAQLDARALTERVYRADLYDAALSRSSPAF